jgi:hypothetical protein
VRFSGCGSHSTGWNTPADTQSAGTLSVTTTPSIRHGRFYRRRCALFLSLPP